MSLHELLKDHKINQIGYLYKDIDKQAERMEKMLGMPKFAINPNAKSRATYRGKPTEIEAKIGMSRIMNTQIELIQWISGECYHKEYLEKYGEGFYHLSVIVDDIKPYFELFKSLNLEVLQDRYIGKQHAVYFDTKEVFGVVLEFQATERRERK
jgi:hypothetical protein